MNFIPSNGMYIRQNILYLRPTISILTTLAIVYLIISNTDNKSIIEKEIIIVKQMQNKGNSLPTKGKIFFTYLHLKSNIAKMGGNIIAAQLFNHRGLTSSPIYQDSELFQETLGSGPLFDKVNGNIAGSLYETSSKNKTSCYTNDHQQRIILQENET